jgi:hypothetical protein
MPGLVPSTLPHRRRTAEPGPFRPCGCHGAQVGQGSEQEPSGWHDSSPHPLRCPRWGMLGRWSREPGRCASSCGSRSGPTCKVEPTWPSPLHPSRTQRRAHRGLPLQPGHVVAAGCRDRAPGLACPADSLTTMRPRQMASPGGRVSGMLFRTRCPQTGRHAQGSPRLLQRSAGLRAGCGSHGTAPRCPARNAVGPFRRARGDASSRARSSVLRLGSRRGGSPQPWRTSRLLRPCLRLSRSLRSVDAKAWRREGTGGPPQPRLRNAPRLSTWSDPSASTNGRGRCRIHPARCGLSN